MPSSKFTNPKNGDTIPSGADFTISMAIKNLQTGNFVNAQKNYFAAPQQLNGGGTIVGHSHVVVEKLSGLDQTTPTNPKEFIFFKVRELIVILNIIHLKILQGLNAAAQGGTLTADVPGGVPAGAYRLCSINTSANHQPAIVPVAQHGSLDDCVYVSLLVPFARVQPDKVQLSSLLLLREVLLLLEFQHQAILLYLRLHLHHLQLRLPLA